MKSKEHLEIEKAKITTMYYEYSLQDINKVYMEEINRLCTRIEYLGNQARDQIIEKYTDGRNGSLRTEVFKIQYTFENNLLYVNFSTLKGKESYVYDGNKLPKNALRNTALIYSLMQAKELYVNSFNNLEIENTDLRTSTKPVNSYLFDFDNFFIYENEITLIDNENKKVEIKNKATKKDIKF